MLAIQHSATLTADPSSIYDQLLIDLDVWVLQVDVTNKISPVWRDSLAKLALEQIGPRAKMLGLRQPLFVGMCLAEMLHRLSDVDQYNDQEKSHLLKSDGSYHANSAVLAYFAVGMWNVAKSELSILRSGSVRLEHMRRNISCISALNSWLQLVVAENSLICQKQSHSS